MHASEVAAQVARPEEAEVAAGHVAGEGAFVAVATLVQTQVRHAAERVVACCTGVWALARVPQPVDLHVAVARKAAAAHGTREALALIVVVQLLMSARIPLLQQPPWK